MRQTFFSILDFSLKIFAFNAEEKLIAVSNNIFGDKMRKYNSNLPFICKVRSNFLRGM
jgi:hypothetical protein